VQSLMGRDKLRYGGVTPTARCALRARVGAGGAIRTVQGLAGPLALPLGRKDDDELLINYY